MPTKPNKRRRDRDSAKKKKFQKMIVIMIQDLENKMELEINSLDTMIEKMQEMFNKNLLMLLVVLLSCFSCVRLCATA